MKAWHFTGDTLRDGSPLPKDGELLQHEGEVSICESGLHASERIIDALQYAPGNTICRVECDDIVEKQDDKFVCRERTIIWRIEDTESLLREFARKCALDVIDLWDAPQVVRDYLETGDESLRAAAGVAAGVAAWDAAGVAAKDAAWVAARGAAGVAAKDAAGVAAKDAAWVAAGVAAKDAARDAAWDAAWVAVWDTARDTARDAAWDAARDVKTGEFNTKLEAMVMEAQSQLLEGLCKSLESAAWSLFP